MDHTLPLLHLDADLVAIAKPAGLLVHPRALDAHEERSALKLLRDQLGSRVWPLHRLDKATSGVLLFARHAEAAREWGLAFEQGRVGGIGRSGLSRGDLLRPVAMRWCRIASDGTAS